MVKCTRPHTKPKNHPPADKTSSGRVIGIVGDVAPAPSLRELSSESETEGVSSDEWWNVKTSEFRRGDENRPQRWILASSRVNGESHPGSLSEGAGSPKG